MLPDYVDFLIKRFENPDEVRTFEKGRFELIKIGGMTIGRATYEPGWKWSQHVAPVAGTSLCQVEHIGMVISGEAACAMEDGRSYVMKPGDIFYIGPGHDSWVVGDHYVSIPLKRCFTYENRVENALKMTLVITGRHNASTEIRRCLRSFERYKKGAFALFFNPSEQ